MDKGKRAKMAKKLTALLSFESYGSTDAPNKKANQSN